MKNKWVQGLLFALAVIVTGCGSSEINTTTEEPGHTESEHEDNQRAEVDEGSESKNMESESAEEDLHSYDFTIDMTGDINLADDWNSMEYYAQQENGIYDCIDPELIDLMQQADLTWANMEFSISDRGEPMAGKAYTFRADPSHVDILRELGVTLANLANNHVYDYGKDAFEDTLQNLSTNGIPYVGAGKNAEEAQSPFYLEIDGKTVACVSATRAEKNILTPEAGVDTPGVFRCYDMDRLLDIVREAKAQADFVIVYVHWGTEYSETLERSQTDGARELVEAGADAVVGAHPHCLQGVEYYKDVPILYSLGNYWFNEKTLDTTLLRLHFSGNDEEEHLEVQMIPARQEDHYTTKLTDEEEIDSWIRHMKQMSPSAIEIDENGILREAESLPSS